VSRFGNAIGAGPHDVTRPPIGMQSLQTLWSTLQMLEHASIPEPKPRLVQVAPPKSSPSHSSTWVTNGQPGFGETRHASRTPFPHAETPQAGKGGAGQNTKPAPAGRTGGARAQQNAAAAAPGGPAAPGAAAGADPAGGAADAARVAPRVT